LNHTAYLRKASLRLSMRHGNGGEAKDVRNPICLINKRTETNCQGLAKLEHKEVSR
jgi:hypothetical protein